MADKKVLHNDIKPDNIAFDGKRFKILDFNCAVELNN